MSKDNKEDEKSINLSKYSTGSYDTITVNGFNGISESDLITGDTVIIDWSSTGYIPMSSYHTDSLTTVTLKEVEFDFQNTDTITINTDVKQGDLFNGWPEDGAPGVTITLNEEK